MTESARTVYHYLKLGRLGRGEVVKLFLIDAGIDFEEKLYAYDDTWPQSSEALKQQGITRTGQVPALAYKGSILTQHIPTLRYLARDLGRYDGETNKEKYIVDAVSDIYIDWRSQWVADLKQKSDEYREKYTPKYYDLVAQYYSDFEGPYLLGDKVTYVDFAVFQSLDNDKRTGTLPPNIPAPLLKLQQAFKARPNIAEYIRKHEDS